MKSDPLTLVPCLCCLAAFAALLGGDLEEPSETEYAILSAVIDDLDQWSDSGFSVVVAETDGPAAVDHLKMKKWFTGSDEGVYRSFIANGRRPARFTTRLVTKLPYKLVPRAEVDALFAGYGLGWKGFHGRFPNANHLVILSRPGIDADGRKAVVYLEWHSDRLVGQAQMILLERQDDRWHVTGQIPLWVT